MEAIELRDQQGEVQATLTDEGWEVASKGLRAHYEAMIAGGGVPAIVDAVEGDGAIGEVVGVVPPSDPEFGYYFWAEMCSDLTCSVGMNELADLPVEAYFITSVEKGGPGSGNFGHAGRPGHRGGSAGAGGVARPGLEKVAGGVVGVNQTLGSKLTTRNDRNADDYFVGGGKTLREAAETTLSRLPQGHLVAAPQNITVFDDRDEFTEATGLSDSTASFRPNGFGGRVSLDGSTLDNLELASQQRSLVHEVGHGVHIALDPPLFREGGWDHHKTWSKGIVGSEGRRRTFNKRLKSMYSDAQEGKRTVVRDYAKSDVREYFAVAYESYVYRPGELKKSDSDLYGLMKSYVFGGVEYAP